VKTNIESVDAAEVLQKLATIPITSWAYLNERENVRHIGPMAQDFKAAFGFGADSVSISTIDADGIALAAIQELYRKTLELDQLRTEIIELRHTVQALLAKQQNQDKFTPMACDK